VCGNSQKRRNSKSKQSPVRTTKVESQGKDRFALCRSSSMSCGRLINSSAAALDGKSVLRRSSSSLGLRGPVLGGSRDSTRRKSVRIADNAEKPPDNACQRMGATAARDELPNKQSGGERSCNISLPITARTEGEICSSAKKDIPCSMKDTPKSTKDTPHAITDAALLKSRLLLQQLEQFEQHGLLEDVEYDTYSTPEVEEPEIYEMSPVSKMPANTLVSSVPSIPESSTTDGVETLDIAHMPAKCLEMIQGMWEELVRLRSKELPPADAAPKPDMVSVPSGLLEMLAKMWKEIEDSRSRDPSQVPHTDLATFKTQSVASILSQATTADGLDEEWSIGDSTSVASSRSRPQADAIRAEINSIQTLLRTSQAEVSSILAQISSNHSQLLLQQSGCAPPTGSSENANQADMKSNICSPQMLLRNCQSEPLPLPSANHQGPPSASHDVASNTSPPPHGFQPLQSPGPAMRSPIVERPAVTQSRISSPIVERPAVTQSRLSSPIVERPAVTQSRMPSPIVERPAVTQSRLPSPIRVRPAVTPAATPAMTQRLIQPESRLTSPMREQPPVTQSPLLAPTLLRQPTPLRNCAHPQHAPFSYIKRTVSIQETVSIQDTIITVL